MALFIPALTIDFIFSASPFVSPFYLFVEEGRKEIGAVTPLSAFEEISASSLKNAFCISSDNLESLSATSA